MPRTDELDDDLEEETDDDSPLVKKLRSQLKESSKKAKRADELETELGDYKRKDAITGAGLKLNDRQVKALLAAHDGEVTAEGLKATAIELGFAQKSQEDEELEEDLAAQERIAAAAAGGGQAPGATVLTPADVAQWPVDKTMRFRQQHPVEFEALKRGEEVTGITF